MHKHKMYIGLLCFDAYMALIGLVLGDISTIIPGLLEIIRTEDMLITDYIAIAGVGAAFINSALVTLVSIAIMFFAKKEQKGSL